MDDREPAVRGFLPEPLELLPERDDLAPPQFAVEGLTALHTNTHFKPLEEIYEMNSTQATIAVRPETSFEQLFHDTIYQKYEQPASVNRPHGIIRCRMSKNNKELPRIIHCLLRSPLNSLPINNVRFDSRFESGNLGLVSRVSPTEFNLLLDNDINTSGFTQWFFFRVEVDRQCKLRFNLLNFRKRNSLFQRGMKVCVYSRRNNERSGEGWVRDGTEISYQRSELPSSKVHYTLSFSYVSKFAADELLFSYHYPYTYSDLQRFYQSLTAVKCLKRTMLCVTPCRNRLHCLTITENCEKWRPVKKKYVFVMARAHPGQTIGSLLVQRLVRYLISNQKEAAELRHMYVFKIIPMINPDGVLHGNSRCSLPGRDLNRSWDKPDPYLFPQVYALKKMILDVSRHSPIALVCDFHGHSLKKDAFIYGCHKKNHPFATREFPWVLSRLCKNFNYGQCAFSNSTSSKAGTARISLFRSLKIANVFTLETSFCGPSQSLFHWAEDDLKDLMKCFCLALRTLGSKPKPATKKQEKAGCQEDEPDDTDRSRNEMLEELHRSKQNYERGMQDDCSDSEIQEDYLDEDIFAFSSEPPHEHSSNVSIQKRSKSFVLRHERQTSEENSAQQHPSRKLAKGRSIIKRKSKASADRLDQFENIRFWVGTDKMETPDQSPTNPHRKGIKNHRSRTEATHPELFEQPRPRDLQLDLLQIKLHIPKTPEKHKQETTESVQKLPSRKRNSKEVSTLCILPDKLDGLSKKYSPVVYNPQHRYKRMDARTEQPKRPSAEYNFISEHKVFEKRIIDCIDKRLQNYIEVHKLNRYSDAVPPYL